MKNLRLSDQMKCVDMPESNIYVEFGQAFERTVSSWDPEKFRSKRNPGTYDRYLDMVRMVQLATVWSDDRFPKTWGDGDTGVAEGMDTLCAISFMKAAAFGYAGSPKSELHDYMISRDGLLYANKLGRGNGLAATMTESEFSLSNSVQAYPHDNKIKSGKIKIIDRKLHIDLFDDIHKKSKEDSVMAGKRLDVRCQALAHGAYPAIFRAISVLGVHTGVADDIYDRFAAMR